MNFLDLAVGADAHGNQIAVAELRWCAAGAVSFEGAKMLSVTRARVSSAGLIPLTLLLAFRPDHALGAECSIKIEAPYRLRSDTVDWTMQISSGQDCIHGLRLGRATIETAELISPPQSGQVKLLGPGFSYTAPDFEGNDAFTIQVVGTFERIRGSSDIRINVSVGPK